MMLVFIHFLRRMLRDRGLPGQSAGFFALAMLTCVFAVGSEPVILATLLPGLSWALLLLASLLGLPDLLADDDLDDLLLARLPLPATLGAKMLAHACATGLPIAAIAPLGLMLLVPGLHLGILWLGLALAALCFSGIGLLGAALALGSRRNAALQALIVMPLSIPPLIFGAGAISASQLDLGASAPMAFLGALACVIATLSPFAAAWILRMKVTSA